MGIKYKEVADQLRHEILSQNTYSGTKKLPTEQELMERYHVSRQTVRQALSILLAENLIQKRQGSGTYLSEQALSPAHGSGQHRHFDTICRRCHLSCDALGYSDDFIRRRSSVSGLFHRKPLRPGTEDPAEPFEAATPRNPCRRKPYCLSQSKS